MSKVSHCKSCRTEIMWAISPKGNRIPIDAVPVENGEYVIALSGDGVRILQRCDGVFGGVVALGRKRYTSHFKTCPHAARHSRKGAA